MRAMLRLLGAQCWAGAMALGLGGGSTPPILEAIDGDDHGGALPTGGAQAGGRARAGQAGG